MAAIAESGGVLLSHAFTSLWPRETVPAKIVASATI